MADFQAFKDGLNSKLVFNTETTSFIEVSLRLYTVSRIDDTAAQLMDPSLCKSVLVRLYANTNLSADSIIRLTRCSRVSLPPGQVTEQDTENMEAFESMFIQHLTSYLQGIGHVETDMVLVQLQDAENEIRAGRTDTNLRQRLFLQFVTGSEYLSASPMSKIEVINAFIVDES